MFDSSSHNKLINYKPDYVNQVEGDVDKGVVQLHLVKRPGQEDYDYKYLFLDVQGILYSTIQSSTNLELDQAKKF